MTTWLVSLNQSQKRRWKRKVRMRLKRVLRRRVMVTLLKTNKLKTSHRTLRDLAMMRVRAHQKVVMVPQLKRQPNRLIRRKS